MLWGPAPAVYPEEVELAPVRDEHNPGWSTPNEVIRAVVLEDRLYLLRGLWVWFTASGHTPVSSTRWADGTGEAGGGLYVRCDRLTQVWAVGLSLLYSHIVHRSSGGGGGLLRVHNLTNGLLAAAQLDDKVTAPIDWSGTAQKSVYIGTLRPPGHSKVRLHQLIQYKTPRVVC